MMMATLHGTTLEIKMPGGHKETFELARLGTLKEFETAKSALATSKAAEQSLDGLNAELREKVTAWEKNARSSSAAYVAEKETSADLNTKLTGAHATASRLQREHDNLQGDIQQQAGTIGTLRDKLAHEQSEHERTGNALSTEKEVSAELTNANQGLAEGIQRQKDTVAGLTAALEQKNGALDQRTADVDSLIGQRDAARAELDNAKALVTAKTAAEDALIEQRDGLKVELTTVRDDLVAEQEVCADVRSELSSVRAREDVVKQERNASRQALADLRSQMQEFYEAEKTGLDALAAFLEKLSE